MNYESLCLLFTHWFSRSEVNFTKYVNSPRAPFYEMERNLSRRLATQLDKRSRRG